MLIWKSGRFMKRSSRRCVIVYQLWCNYLKIGWREGVAEKKVPIPGAAHSLFQVFVCRDELIKGGVQQSFRGNWLWDLKETGKENIFGDAPRSLINAFGFFFFFSLPFKLWAFCISIFQKCAEEAKNRSKRRRNYTTVCHRKLMIELTQLRLQKVMDFKIDVSQRC